MGAGPGSSTVRVWGTFHHADADGRGGAVSVVRGTGHGPQFRTLALVGNGMRCVTGAREVCRDVGLGPDVRAPVVAEKKPRHL